MSKYGWRFPNLDGGPEQGINNSGIATFNGSDLINNLAREICQNSMDAKSNDADYVRVEFNNIELKKDDFNALSGLEEIFIECQEYWKDREDVKLTSFINEANEKLSKDTINLLVISDYNTTGLDGAKAERRKKSKWRALTHSNGVTDKGAGSGGSYGIGKNAPFACSSFRTIFYNSYSKNDNIKAFQGVSNLITHTHNGEDTQGTGYFYDIDNYQPIFGENPCPLMKQLNRTEYGTDVVVAGFKKTDVWKEDIEKAVITNFFAAIYEGKLEVKIENQVLNKKTLKERIDYYTNNEINIPKSKQTITTIQEYYKAISEPTEVVKGSILEDNDVSLFIKVDDSYSKSIAEMRSIGMVVRTRKNNIFTRYAAVMIVGEGELNNILKDIEPPAHDKWDAGIISDSPEKAAKSEKARKKLIKWVNDTIAEKCRTEESDEIELDGISAFLPLDEDDDSLGSNDEQNDSPDSENVVGQPKTHKNKRNSKTLEAKKVTGKKVNNFDPHNSGKGGNKKGSAGVEDPDGDDYVTAQVSGNKTINMPQILRQRIIQTPANSTYKIVFELQNDCQQVNISLKSVGDDGTKEKLRIIEYRIANKVNSVDSTEFVINNVKANIKQEIFVKLDSLEKMAIDLIIN